MNLNDPCQDKTPFKQAIEDAMVVGAFTATTALVAIGYPPTLAAIYVPILSSITIGIVTYMKARNIQAPKKE